MSTDGSNADWIVVPEQRTLHLWLEHPPSVTEWDEIEASLVYRVDGADRVEFGGPGWATTRSWRMAKLLKAALELHGLTVAAKSPALLSM
jgi:hypothetical protein